MDIKTKTRIEYEHQFFGFSSDTLIDSYKLLLTNKIDSNLNQIVAMLRRKLLPAVADETKLAKTLENFSEKLKGDYERGWDHAMNTCETSIRECFHIPDHILLPDDQVVATVEGVDEAKLDQEIADIENEVKMMAVLMEELKQELQLQDIVLPTLENAAAQNFTPLPKD